MMLHFNVPGPKRKELVGIISDCLGIPAKYLRVPSCAYQIGEFTVSKEGILEWPDSENDKVRRIVETAIAAGFEEPCEWEAWKAENADVPAEIPTEVEETREGEDDSDEEDIGLTVEMPRAFFTDAQLENLKKLVDAKAGLLKQALAIDELPIIITDEKVAFPWFKIQPEPGEATAYTCLISAMCRMAKEVGKVTAKERAVDNPKYAFRCFLLRLGFIGDEYKRSRKTLLQNLPGSSAYRKSTEKGGEQ